MVSIFYQWGSPEGMITPAPATYAQRWACAGHANALSQAPVPARATPSRIIWGCICPRAPEYMHGVYASSGMPYGHSSYVDMHMGPGAFAWACNWACVFVGTGTPIPHQHELNIRKTIENYRKGGMPGKNRTSRACHGHPHRQRQQHILQPRGLSTSKARPQGRPSVEPAL